MEKHISNDDMYLVLASDGLWDVMSNEDVARFMMNATNFTEVAKELCYEATILGSSDNITVVVVDLKTNEQSQSSNNTTPLPSPTGNGNPSELGASSTLLPSPSSSATAPQSSTVSSSSS